MAPADSNPPPRHWHEISEQPSSQGSRPWQPAEVVERKPLSRRAKLLFAGSVLLACLIGIAVLIKWLSPLRPAYFVGLGSGYEQNLLVPHNAAGWNALHALPADHKPERAQGTWPEIWQKLALGSVKHKVVVLAISLLGGADETGAYLVSENGRDKIHFKDILQSLDKLKGKDTVLLLDVNHAEGPWPIGMLERDFVEAATKDCETYGNKDHLVAIFARSKDERSWASAAWGQSVFMQYVIEGLKGRAARYDYDRISAATLFDYVKDKVQEWTKTNRARKQTPMLLGTKAARIELLQSSPPAEPEPSASEEEPGKQWAAWRESLRERWQVWRTLRSSAPYVLSPHLWRRYQETLLRYEQLILAGDPTAQAEELAGRLDELKTEIDRARELTPAMECLGLSFPLYRVLGYLPPSDQKTTDPRGRQFLAMQQGRILLNNAAALQQARKSLREKLAAWFPSYGTEDRAPWAAEIHLLELLGQSEDARLNAEQKSTPEAADASMPPLFRLALRVRQQAEEAALGATESKSYLYSEVISPWIRKDLAEADALRREGEDLACGDPIKHWPKAEEKLTAADDLYRKIKIRAATLRSALSARDDAWADLPYLARWLAVSEPDDKILELRKQLKRLGDSLAAMLDGSAAPAADVLSKLAGAVAADHRSIRQEYRARGVDLRDAIVLQRNWHQIVALLAIPPAGGDDEIETRLDLLQKLREISAGLKGNAGQIEEPEPREARLALQKEILSSYLKPFKAARDVAGESSLWTFFLGLPRRIATAPETSIESLTEAASLSRVLPAGFAAVDPNPVQRLRQHRVADLLLEQAERAWRDHWHHYFRGAAKTYIASARRLENQAKLNLLETKAAALDLQLRHDGLTAPSEVKTVPWTTEKTFELTGDIKAAGLQKQFPAARPMKWVTLKSPVNAKKAEELARREIWHWNAPPAQAIERDDLWGKNLDDAAPQRKAVTFHAFFRGQHERCRIDITYPPPDIILNRFAPRDAAGLAVRMDGSFDYGAISIVLDTSGSMTWLSPAKEGKHVRKKAGQAERCRFDYARDALDHVLRKIPDHTYVSLCTFGADPADMNRSDVKWMHEPEEINDRYRFRLVKKLDEMRQPENFRKYLNDSSPIAKAVIACMETGFPNRPGPRLVLVLTDGVDNQSFVAGKSVVPQDDQEEMARHSDAVRRRLKEAMERYPDTNVIVVCFIDEKTDKSDFDYAKKQFEVVEEFAPRGQFTIQPKGEELGQTIESLLRPQLQVSQGNKLCKELTVNLTNLALQWTELEPSNYQLLVRGRRSKEAAVTLRDGQKIFLVLKRGDDGLYVQRGLLGAQRELSRSARYSEWKNDWLVTLLKHKLDIRDRLEELVIFERASKPDEPIHLEYPGFVWFELEQNGKSAKPLHWHNEWGVPAAGHALEVPQASRAARFKLTTWFSPDTALDFVKNSYVRRLTNPLHSPNGATLGLGNAVIESVTIEEKRPIEGPDGQKRPKDCLVVRLQHEPGKPIWIDLDPRYHDDKRFDRTGVKRLFFREANKCTVMFYDLPRPEVDLIAVDLEEFKKRNASVTFNIPAGEEIQPEREFVRRLKKGEK